MKYYDSVRAEIDIYAEKLSEKYKENDWLSSIYEPKTQRPKSRIKNYGLKTYGIEVYNDSYSDAYTYNDVDTQSTDPKTTKMVDYINGVRAKAIDETKKAEAETLKYYEANKINIRMMRKQTQDDILEEDLNRKMYANSFCFNLVVDERHSLYKLVTVVADFYVNANHIEILK